MFFWKTVYLLIVALSGIAQVAESQSWSFSPQFLPPQFGAGGLSPQFPQPQLGPGLQHFPIGTPLPAFRGGLPGSLNQYSSVQSTNIQLPANTKPAHGPYVSGYAAASDPYVGANGPAKAEIEQSANTYASALGALSSRNIGGGLPSNVNPLPAQNPYNIQLPQSITSAQRRYSSSNKAPQVGAPYVGASYDPAKAEIDQSANAYANTLGAFMSPNIGAYVNAVTANNYQAAVRYSPPNSLVPPAGHYSGYMYNNKFPMFKDKTQSANANAGAQAALNARFRGSRTHNHNDFLSPSNRGK